MRDIRNSIVVIVLVFVSVLMLIASLEYTSNIINAGSEPVDYPVTGDENMGDGSGIPSEIPSEIPKDIPKDVTGSGIDVAQLLGQGDEAKFDPFAAGQDSGPVLAIIVFVATALAGTAAIVYWFTRKRRRKQAMNVSADPAEVHGASTVSPGSFEGLYELRFPQIREPLPLTWGADELLEMTITCKGDVSREIMLSIDDGEARQVMPGGNIVRVMLRLPKGRHRVTVSPGDHDVTGEVSWTDLEIVDYREEIVRLFNELCRSLKSGYADVRDDMTPRELERTICGRMPETGDSIGTAVTVFELANFSTHTVRRAEYERMYLSGMGLL